MLPHPAGDVGRNHVPVCQFNPKHGVGQGLNDDPLHLDMFFLRHAFSLDFGGVIISHVESNHKLRGVMQ